MKQRLLIFHPALAPYRVDFFSCLAEKFDLMVVFQNRHLRTQKFDQERLGMNVRFRREYLPHSRLIGGRVLSLGYTRFIREFRPDIVMGSEFGQTLIVPFLLRPFMRKRFRLWTLTDDSPSDIKNCNGARLWLRKFFAKRLDGVVAANPVTAGWYSDGFGIKAPVVPIIADEGRLRSEVSELYNLRQDYISKYGLEGRKVVLFVGRFNPVKNLPMLLEAFARVRKDASLVLVGEGEMRSTLESLARDAGISDRIVFTGRMEMPELLVWYHVASVSVLPSTSERFGAVVGESLQLGCPVVCSSESGAAWLCDAVVDPRDPDGIAMAINGFLDAPSWDSIRPSLMEHDLGYYIGTLVESIQEN